MVKIIMIKIKILTLWEQWSKISADMLAISPTGHPWKDLEHSVLSCLARPSLHLAQSLLKERTQKFIKMQLAQKAA